MFVVLIASITLVFVFILSDFSSLIFWISFLYFITSSYTSFISSHSTLFISGRCFMFVRTGCPSSAFVPVSAVLGMPKGKGSLQKFLKQICSILQTYRCDKIFAPCVLNMLHILSRYHLFQIISRFSKLSNYKDKTRLWLVDQ